MMRYAIVLLGLCLVSGAAATDDTKAKQTVAAQKYEALVDEYEDAGGSKQFAVRFLALAEKYPQDPAAIDALVWVLKRRRTQPEAIRVIELLEKRHLKNRELGRTCSSIAYVHSTNGEQLLRVVLEKSPHPEVRAQACYYLAELLEVQAGVVEELKQAPKLAGRVLQYYGKDYGKHLAALDSAKLNRELEKVYKRMARSFADTEIDDEKIGEFADRALFRIRHLSVGRVAPEITEEDIAGRELKLSDYRGKVVVLSFWGFW